MPLPAQKLPIKRSQPSTSDKSATSDPRFASLQTDPRYRLPSRKQTHVKLDKRFASILKNDEFSRKARVDRYGRKIEKGAGKKELERLYELESGDEDVDVENELKRVGHEEAKEEKYDPAREGGFGDSSSSSEEESEDEEVEEAELYPAAKGAEVPMGEVSRRIAVVNMDWDHIRAADIMAVAGSFVPEGGRIESVVVYPSEFGRERMEREELEGPPKEIFADPKSKKRRDDQENSDDEDERIRKSLLQEDKGEEFNSTALRRYQIDRLRYYYAVITCSSIAVAAALYDALDNREYLSSANFFDLRFIPDDVDFDETPRDSCGEVPEGYKPTEFATDALNHSKVKLAWDADDEERKQVQKRAFSRKEIDENDLQAYIGSASSSDEEEEEEEEIELLEGNGVDAEVISTLSKSSRADRRDMLRAALGLPLEPEMRSKGKKEAAPVGDMQISFTPGIAASETKRPVFENEPEETTREKYIRKERERKAKRKERMKARRDGKDPDVVEQGKELDVTNGSEGEADIGAGIDGFNDPFFDEPASASVAVAKKARKQEKAKMRKERAEEEEAVNESKRAELELLMADDKDVRHFDMKEIAKAEKNKKKKKKGKRSEDEDEKEAAGNDFQMDVKDPRFSRLFESHEFAIDPTNPRFKGTEGMKALLEEGRKKRKLGQEIDGEDTKAGKKVKTPADGEAGKDVSQLVAKLKKKSR